MDRGALRSLGLGRLVNTCNGEEVCEDRRARRGQGAFDEQAGREQNANRRGVCGAAMPGGGRSDQSRLHDCLRRAAVSRIRVRGQFWEVVWWSHRDKWESIGDLGGMIFDTIDEAAKYVLDDPMGVFW